MVESVSPPPGEVTAEDPSAQHPKGLFYLDEGASRTVVEVFEGTLADPRFYVLGHAGSANLSDFPAKVRLLGPVVMPFRDDERQLINPAPALADLIHTAYQSGFSAGATDLPADLRKTVEARYYDRAAYDLLQSVASGGRPRLTTENNLDKILTNLVDKVLEIGQQGRPWDGRRADADALRDAAFLDVAALVGRADPHHVDPERRTYSAEDYEAWNGENAKLRSVVLWAAGKIHDPKTHRELAAKIRAASVQDQEEEDEIQMLDFRKAVDVVCDLIDAAVDCRIPEVDTSREDTRPGLLPLYWSGKAANAASKLREACCDLPEIRTLARVRFA